MGENFGELNDIDIGGRSIGYVVNMKWFESWCTYMQKEYGYQVAGRSHLTYARTVKTFKTMKTVRTKKTIKSLKSGKSLNSGLSHKKIHDLHKLRHLPVSSIGPHFNLIHYNIGDKPPQIYNNLLEGEFS